MARAWFCRFAIGYRTTAVPTFATIRKNSKRTARYMTLSLPSSEMYAAGSSRMSWKRMYARIDVTNVRTNSTPKIRPCLWSSAIQTSPFLVAFVRCPPVRRGCKNLQFFSSAVAEIGVAIIGFGLALDLTATARDAPSVRLSGGRSAQPHNFRRREWAPAVEADVRPATPYDLRDTFASNALHAGVTVFELARVMGTSVRMIEKHYGALVDGAHAAILDRLDGLAAAEL